MAKRVCSQRLNKSFLKTNAYLFIYNHFSTHMSTSYVGDTFTQIHMHICGTMYIYGQNNVWHDNIFMFDKVVKGFTSSCKGVLL